MPSRPRREVGIVANITIAVCRLGGVAREAHIAAHEQMVRRVSESGAVTATVLSVSTALHRQEAGPMRTRANGGQDFQMLFLLPHGTLATAQRGGAQRQMGMRGLKRARGKW